MLRTAPSAGALHPLETYCFIDKVEGLTEGIYHFCVHDFLLEKLSSGQFGSRLSKACLGQGFLAESAVTICWSVVFRRTMSKYADRGLRYIFMDVGHVCQNLLLAAESMNLAACPVGAFWDDDLNNLLQLDGEEESAVYCVAIGPK